MSNKSLGFLPKSGEQMLKDALGQFKGIIAQIQTGVKKVQSKVLKNAVEFERLQNENISLTKAVDEALIVSENLEKMLSGEIVVLPASDKNEKTDKD